MRFHHSPKRESKKGKEGYKDEQIILALILLKLGGGFRLSSPLYPLSSLCYNSPKRKKYERYEKNGKNISHR
jgi:hypothetical protein